MNFKIRLKVSAITAVSILMILMALPWKQNSRLFCSAQDFVLYCSESSLFPWEHRATNSASNIKLLDFSDLGYAQKSDKQALSQYVNEFISCLRLVSLGKVIVICLPDFLAHSGASDLLKKFSAENQASNMILVGASTFSAVDNAPVNPVANWALKNCSFTGFHKPFADVDEKVRSYPLLRKGSDVYPSLLASSLAAIFGSSLDKVRLSTGCFAFELSDGSRKSIPITSRGDYTLSDFSANYEFLDSDSLASGLVKQADFNDSIIIVGPVEKGRNVNVPQFIKAGLPAKKITDTELFVAALSGILDSRSLKIETGSKFIGILLLYFIISAFIFTVMSHTIGFILYILIALLSAMAAGFAIFNIYLHFPIMLIGLTAVFIAMRIFVHFYQLFKSRLVISSLGTKFGPDLHNAVEMKRGFPYDLGAREGILVSILEPGLENGSLIFGDSSDKKAGIKAVKDEAAEFHGRFNDFSFKNRGLIIKRGLGSLLVFLPLNNIKKQKLKDEKKAQARLEENNEIVNRIISDVLDTRIAYVKEFAEKSIKNGLLVPNPVIALFSGEINSGFISVNGLDDFVAAGPDLDLTEFLCSLNNLMGTMIISGPGVHKASKNRFISRKLDTIQFSACKKGALQIFEIIGKRNNESDPSLRAYINDYERALTAYLKGDFEVALGLFEKHIENCPKDGAARILMARSQEYMAQPPLLWKKGFDWKRF